MLMMVVIILHFLSSELLESSRVVDIIAGNLVRGIQAHKILGNEKAMALTLMTDNSNHCIFKSNSEHFFRGKR